MHSSISSCVLTYVSLMLTIVQRECSVLACPRFPNSNAEDGVVILHCI